MIVETSINLSERLAVFLHPGTDSFRDGSVLLSLAVLLVGLAVLAWRAAAAWRGHDPLASLVPLRMIAVLGALGGFVTYLRDLPATDAGLGLALGGASALPWAAVTLLEGIRRLAARRRRPAERE